MSIALKLTARQAPSAREARPRIKAAVIHAVKLTAGRGRLNEQVLATSLERSFDRLFDGRRLDFGPIERALTQRGVEPDEIYLCWSVLRELLQGHGVGLTPTRCELGAERRSTLEKRAQLLAAPEARRESARGKKLGEILVERGILSDVQLQAALRSQHVHGGRLGTRMVEMGLLDERTLGETLADQHGVLFCALDEIAAIPEDARQALPRAFQLQHRALPVRVQGRSLFVVMADPTDLGVVDAIAFQTGYRVQPMVAPAAKLEDRLGVERQAKLRSLSLPSARPVQPEAFEIVHTHAPRGAGIEDEETTPARPLPGHPAIATIRRGDYLAAADGFSAGEESPAQKLARAEHGGEVLEALRDHLASRYRHVAAFVVEAGAARLVRAADCADLRIPIAPGSMLETATTQSRAHLSRGARAEGERRALAPLGLAATGALVLPVRSADGVVGLVLAAGLGEGQAHEPGAGRLLEKAQLALQLVALRARLLAD